MRAFLGWCGDLKNIKYSRENRASNAKKHEKDEKSMKNSAKTATLGNPGFSLHWCAIIYFYFRFCRRFRVGNMLISDAHVSLDFARQGGVPAGSAGKSPWCPGFLYPKNEHEET